MKEFIEQIKELIAMQIQIAYLKRISIDHYDNNTICPECQKRLKALLYQEKEE